MTGNSPYSGSGAAASSHCDVSGTATYKWRWVPPLNAAGQPDLVNFPVPPLFVLGRVDGHLMTMLATPGNTAGLAASGTLSDGWHDGWGGTVNGYPQYVPAGGGSARKVLTAGPDGQDTRTYSVLLSPSLTLDIAGLSIGPGSTQGHPNPSGNGGGSAQVNAQPFPIVLTSPNPLTNPLRGDGGNQFVYDARQPDGYLTVPASANAAGASSDDTAWLLPHVGLFVSPAMQTGAQPFQWLNSSSQMYAYTPGTYPDDGTSYPSAAFIYKGLPPNNTYFGNHLMTMKVDNQPSQTANYRLFFNRTVSNWPGSDGVTPNWFHYWNMTSASFGSPTYDNGSRCHTSYDTSLGKWVAYIDNDTVSGPFASYGYAEGIDAFAWECRHEAEHVELLRGWWGESPGIISPNPIDPMRDQDGDHIPDAQEHTLGMQFHPELNGYDPTHKVTPGLTDHFGYGPDYNDNEDYTQHMQRQNHPWTNGSADNENWAYPGHQFH